MPTQLFQKDGSLIELAQGIGADTLSIVCTGAHVRRRVEQSLKMERPNVAATCSCLRDRNSHGLKSRLRAGTLAERRENTLPGLSRRRVPGVSAPGPVTSSLSPACKGSIRRPTHWCRIPTPEFARLSSISG